MMLDLKICKGCSSLRFSLNRNALAYIQGKEKPAERNNVNDAYVDLGNGMENIEASPAPGDLGTSNLEP